MSDQGCAVRWRRYNCLSMTPGGKALAFFVQDVSAVMRLNVFCRRQICYDHVATDEMSVNLTICNDAIPSAHCTIKMHCTTLLWSYPLSHGSLLCNFFYLYSSSVCNSHLWAPHGKDKGSQNWIVEYPLCHGDLMPTCGMLIIRTEQIKLL